MSEYNLEPPYTEEENNRALELTPLDLEREDLTSLFCITIDPHDAKDFDDAVSISPGDKEDEVVLGVHIADVATWVQPGSWIDSSAKKRGFTAYIPGKTLHMLPGVLTNMISLKADNEFCFAHSVLMTVDKNTGFIKKFKRCHSKVNICKRLNFGEVEDYLKNKAVQEDWTPELLENLDRLCELYRLMRKYRESVEHFLNLETTEIRVLRDDATKNILGIECKKQGEADCLVEEFMLAANSTVAREMVNSEIPAVFRIHPEPEPEKLEEFSQFVKSVFDIDTGALWQGRSECQKFLNSISGNKNEEIICSFFLRAMNRALYSEKYGLHYGLGKGLYLHFTSPIRRYSDLIVHQQLILKDLNKKLMSSDTMASVAEDCTMKEKNNDEAYYAANDRLKLHYLQMLLESKKLEMYEGIISSVNASGMIADLPSIGLTAFIPIELISGTFNKRYGRLLSEKGGNEYKPGDFVYLQLVKIDFIKGTAIFKPIQY